MFTPGGIRSGELAKSLLEVAPRQMAKSGLAMDAPNSALSYNDFRPLAMGCEPTTKISRTILNDYECSSIC